MLKKIKLRTEIGEDLVDVTSEIDMVIQDSGIIEGACLVFIPHTTAGITINSALDVNTTKDILHELDRLVPTRVDFYHQYDTPQDAAGHIKSVLVGQSQSIIISEGGLKLGSSQSVLFCEFDGPRDRQVWLRILQDKD
ncbi:MAG: secondary thiamine-phosphate synthase enzyme YjbQ [Chloroflexota bacterium]|nr:secondary thiamine-phosphate synthase enzyme YjbQ [Chloroflexota bacterium]